MSKPTPGPWQIHSDHFPYHATIVGNIDGPLEDGQLSYSTVCDVAETRDFDANCRLIAAAPELLNALRQARDYLDCIPESAAGGDDEAVRIARLAKSAIAKATGEQP